MHSPHLRRCLATLVVAEDNVSAWRQSFYPTPRIGKMALSAQTADRVLLLVNRQAGQFEVANQLAPSSALNYHGGARFLLVGCSS